jgi:hypothetical protein
MWKIHEEIGRQPKTQSMHLVQIPSFLEELTKDPMSKSPPSTAGDRGSAPSPLTMKLKISPCSFLMLANLIPSLSRPAKFCFQCKIFLPTDNKKQVGHNNFFYQTPNLFYFISLKGSTFFHLTKEFQKIKNVFDDVRACLSQKTHFGTLVL